RQATFTVIGAVGGAGSYLIPEADYRLLEALAQACGFPECTDEIYINRQIALSDLTTGGYLTAPPGEGHGDGESTDRTGLEDLIEGLRSPRDSEGGGGAPGAFGAATAVRAPRQDERSPAVDLPQDRRPRGDQD